MSQVAGYAQPLLGYAWPGAGYLRPYTPPSVAAGAVIPRPNEIQIRAQDTSGAQVRILTNVVQAGPIGQVRFELLPTGPGVLEIDLAPGVTLQHEWALDLYLWGDAIPIWSGFVQSTPEIVSTEFPLHYTAMGWFARLDMIDVDATYGKGLTVRDIVRRVVREWVSARSPIAYSEALNQQDPRDVGNAYVLQDDLHLRHVSAKAALDQLANLAGGYEYGVDAQRRFFFRAPLATVTSRWWVGRHLSQITGPRDSSQVRNRLIVKSGKRNASTKDSFLANRVEDAASQATYGVREAVVTAPSVYADADAYRWAGSELTRLKDAPSQLRVQGLHYDGTQIDCTGQALVTDPAGNTIQLRKKRCGYTVKEGVVVDVDIGALPPAIPVWLQQVLRQQAASELAQANLNQQF